MLAGTYATVDMKKDVNELVEAASEVKKSGVKELLGLINLAHRAVLKKDNYVYAIKELLEYKLGVLEITGDDSTALQPIADKIAPLLTKYDRKQLLIVLASSFRMINKKKHDVAENNDTQLNIKTS